MFHLKLKDTLKHSIATVTSHMDSFVYNPGRDYSRIRKLSPDHVISFLISQGASSTKCEFLDFFQMSEDLPSISALNQRRSQMMPEALEAVFHEFTSSSEKLELSKQEQQYQYIAADGSTTSFFSFSKYSSDDYFISEGHSASGFYSIHINAFYDINKRIYTDAILQSAHKKDEFLAFCQLVDRHIPHPDQRTIFIGDRGYCSYNNMAHVVEQGQYFLFRTKDIHSKGLVGNFNFPDAESFDIDVSVILVRSHSKKVLADIHTEGYIRFVDQAAAFDYIEYGSYDTYELSFRILRFPISTSTYECIVTNLPRDEFPVERIKTLYNTRWSIESSFRKLKYTIGLSNFHAYKPEYVKQEIWARLLAYNITETMINYTLLEKHRTKHEYKVNFTMAAHICRAFLRLTTEKDQYDVMSLLKKELIPIRNERQYPRLQTAHFRRPRYFIYRAA